MTSGSTLVAGNRPTGTRIVRGAFKIFCPRRRNELDGRKCICAVLVHCCGWVDGVVRSSRNFLVEVQEETSSHGAEQWTRVAALVRPSDNGSVLSRGRSPTKRRYGLLGHPWLHLQLPEECKQNVYESNCECNHKIRYPVSVNCYKNRPRIYLGSFKARGRRG